MDRSRETNQQQSRTEQDALGQVAVPAGVLWGVHTQRAIVNFPLAEKNIHIELFRAYGTVKLACAQTSRILGAWKDNPEKADAIERACRELADGLLDESCQVDALQGGAGTSTNMNVNEVVANRALQILAKACGDYAAVSPLDDVNLHQSTNDTYPTALRLAAIRMIKDLEEAVVALQELFQQKEQAVARIVKVGRTEMQDAVLTTLGREMGAYAESIGRDRWRIYKCEERLRVVNLGGTAIGTGLAAPRQYIFQVVETLRELTGIGFARAENLVEATQNADVFVEVSGILKALATSLYKIANDLRLMSSGPEAGLAEITLPARQAGSSIMPGKVNPVIPEAVMQAAMQVFGFDAVLTQACANGTLELNPFLPLVAENLLGSIRLLTNACKIFREYCVEGMTANEEVCARSLHNTTALVTALVPVLGYDTTSRLARQAKETGTPFRELVLSETDLDESSLMALLTPEAVCRLGMPGSFSR